MQGRTKGGASLLTEPRLSPRAAPAYALNNSLGAAYAINRLIGSELSDVGRERVARWQEAVRPMLSSIAEDRLPDDVAEARSDTFICTPEPAKALVIRARDRTEAPRVDLFIQAEVSGVFGDAHALAEALGNFVLDAIEATLAGGSVCVATRECADQSLFWTVQDTGPGIPPHFVKHLGTPSHPSETVAREAVSQWPTA